MPPQPLVKPKLSAQEQRRRREDRLAALRLRMAIGRALEERGIADPAAIGAALGLPAVEATKLLTRHQWREGDVALLTAAAARLGLPTGGAPARDCDRDDDRQKPSECQQCPKCQRATSPAWSRAEGQADYHPPPVSGQALSPRGNQPGTVSY